MNIDAKSILTALSYEETKCFSDCAGTDGDSLINDIISVVVSMCNSYLRTGGYASIADRASVPDSLGLFVLNIAIYVLLKRIPYEIEASRITAHEFAMKTFENIGAGLFIPDGIDKLPASDNNPNDPGHSNNFRRRLSTLY